jgi:hypothetical protein
VVEQGELFMEQVQEQEGSEHLMGQLLEEEQAQNLVYLYLYPLIILLLLVLGRLEMVHQQLQLPLVKVVTPYLIQLPLKVVVVVQQVVLVVQRI